MCQCILLFLECGRIKALVYRDFLYGNSWVAEDRYWFLTSFIIQEIVRRRRNRDPQLHFTYSAVYVAGFCITSE